MTSLNFLVFILEWPPFLKWNSSLKEHKLGLLPVLAAILEFQKFLCKFVFNLKIYWIILVFKSEKCQEKGNQVLRIHLPVRNPRLVLKKGAARVGSPNPNLNHLLGLVLQLILIQETLSPIRLVHLSGSRIYLAIMVSCRLNLFFFSAGSFATSYRSCRVPFTCTVYYDNFPAGLISFLEGLCVCTTGLIYAGCKILI